MFWNQTGRTVYIWWEWLTLTWDVLKYEKGYTEAYQNGINFNMGCFEIQAAGQYQGVWVRLTLTWDVLKLTTTFSTDISVIGLTLTWDVLK